MNHKLPFRAALAFIIALALQACAIGIPQPAVTETLEPTLAQEAAPSTLEATPGQEVAPQTTASQLCSNPLYPVESGATWTYQSTGGLSGDFSFTDTITEIRGEGFTLASQINGTTFNQEWVCKPEGLASLTFGGGVAGGLSTSGVQMNVTTSNVQGVILPSSVTAGDEWNYSLDFEGDMEYSQTTVDTQGTASFAFSAVGEESVTVPAGTFEAMKIHVDMTLDMQVTYSGFTAPALFIVPSDIWYAPGVGWVKAASAGDIFGFAFNERIELQSYTLP